MATQRNLWSRATVVLAIVSLFLAIQGLTVSSVGFLSVNDVNFTIKNEGPSPLNLTFVFNATVFNASVARPINGSSGNPSATCTLNTSDPNRVNAAMNYTGQILYNFIRPFDQVAYNIAVPAYVFRANATFPIAGNRSYNISCAVSGMGVINVSDNFTVTGPDVVTPNVSFFFPNGTNFSSYAGIFMGVTALDDVRLDTVLFNVTYPNGTFRSIKGSPGFFGPFFHAEDFLAVINGRINVTIDANDTSNNRNATERFFFYNNFDCPGCNFFGGNFLNGSHTFDSNITNSNISYTYSNGTQFFNASVSNSTLHGGFMNLSTFVNSTAFNSTMFRSYFNNSFFVATNVTNSTIYGGVYNFSFMDHMEAFNSSMFGSFMNRSFSLFSNFTNASVFFSRMNFSFAINATITNTTSFLSFINLSVVIQINATNSSILVSTANVSTIIISNITNASEIYYSIINTTSTFNSSISNSNTNNSFLGNYTADNSTITGSTLIDSTTRNNSLSGVDNSVLLNTTCVDCFLNGSMSQNMTIWTSNVSDGSILNHSYLANSSMDDSNLTDASHLQNSSADGAGIANSTVTNSVLNQTIMDNSTVEMANITGGTYLNYSDIENATVDSSNLSGVVVGSCVIDDANLFRVNVSANDTFSTNISFNMTFFQCYVNNSVVDNMSVTNANVTAGSVLNSSTAANSTIEGSNLSSGSTSQGSTADGSTVQNSTLLASHVNGTVMVNTSAHTSNLSDSYSNNSYIANYSVSNSSVIGTTIIDSNRTSNTTTIAVDNVSLLNSTIYESYLNSSMSQNTTIWTSNVTGGSITNHSFIGNATVDDSNITDASNIQNASIDGATVTNSTVTNTNINSSLTDNTSLQYSNVSNSYVNNSLSISSTMENSTVTSSSMFNTTGDNSTVISSTVTSSHLNGSFIDPSVITNSTTTNANITESTVMNSTIINSTIINSTVNSSRVNNSVVSLSNLSGMDVINVSIHNSTKLENLTLRNILLIVGEPFTPMVQNGSAAGGLIVQANVVQINVNVTDNSTIGVVLANVTKPDGTVHTITLTASAIANHFTGFFDNTSLAGRYNITFDVNDSVNLRNATHTNNFTVQAANYSFNLLTINTTVEPEVNVSRNVTYQVNVTNYGQNNLTNVTVTLNFNSKYINYSISSPGSQANGTGVVSLGDATQRRGLAPNGSLLINFTFTALSNHTNLTTTVNITARNAIGNITQQNTTINITIQLVIPTVAQLQGFAAVLADNFTNLTTNFSLVPDLANVSGLQVANRNGTINWSFSNVNAMANIAPIGDQIRIGRGALAMPNSAFLALNTSSFHQSFNVSARITFYNVSCARSRPVVNFNDSIFQTAIDVASRGRDCVSAGVCINLSCLAGSDGLGNLSFTALHFTSFASSGNANLTITNDANRAGDLTTFNATYINATNGDLINGSTCNISITDDPDRVTNMTVDISTTRFFFQKTPSTAGNYVVNVTCTGAGYTTVNAIDNITLVPVSGSGGIGGGSGGSGGGYTRRNTGFPASPSGTTPPPTPAPAAALSAFDILDLIKNFYSGQTSTTAFEILDKIKAYYRKPSP